MIEPDQLLFFLGASFVLLVAPGPAILYLVAESLDRGRRSGIAASAGLTAGNLVHVAAASAGLSALLATSALAFSVLKYAGAAYLVFLGVRQLVGRRRDRRNETAVELAAASGKDAGCGQNPRPWYSFRRGMVVNVLNPKVAIFFLAFFPQFVDPGRGSASLQLLFLGLLFAILTLLVNVAYVVAASTVAELVRRRAAGRMGLLAGAAGYVPGVVYIALGVSAALARVERQ